MSVQAPSAVVLIRPHHFTSNPETAADNQFQRLDPSLDPAVVAARGFDEATALAATLTAHGIMVHVFDDERDDRPDSVFPNNWFSTHPGGHIAVYPMLSISRRRERRADIIDFLKSNYRVQEVLDLSGLEHDDIFLEGTGAMVLDHVSRVAYACRSNRANPIALERFCTRFGYEPMAFDAVDADGTAIYHTNVLMCVASGFVLVGSAMIPDKARRQEMLDRLAAPGRTVVTLTSDQIAGFAGNAIELQGSDGRILALSTTAAKTLTGRQREVIEQSAKIIEIDVGTIELAGGSLRCMVAGIHLEPRTSR